MPRVKQAPKRKRVAKAVAVPALGAAGLGLSLAGGASASTMPTEDVPHSLNTVADQRFVLGEEEIADVSLATFHLFDKESGTSGFRQVAAGCRCGGCRGCGCRGCRCGGCRACRCGGCWGCASCCLSWGGCRFC